MFPDYSLMDLIFSIAALLISFTVHEFSHAFISYRLGDPTAKNQGRLTLNPLKHLDVLGTLMFFISRFRFGWAKPVPINPMYYRDRKKGTMLVSLAGPLSNVLLAMASAVMIALIGNPRGTVPAVLVAFGQVMYGVNISLAVFNILPVPPLDGSKILGGLLPSRVYFKMLEYERYIQLIFLAVIFMVPGLLSAILTPFYWAVDRAISYMVAPLYGLFGSVKIKIQNFEGPMDLLFHLIEKNQINIYDIPISDITDQYMDYLFQMQEMDMEIASEFLVMAATLLHIKSRMLLPTKKEKEDEGLDPREELVIKLLEYKKYKEVTKLLKEKEAIWDKVYFKLPEPVEVKKTVPLGGLNPEELASFYRELLQKNYNKINRNEKNINQIIQQEKVSLKSKIHEIINILLKKPFFMFSEIFSLKQKSSTEVVTGFLAVLELTRMKKVTLEQTSPSDDIFVYRKNRNEQFLDIDIDEIA